MVLRQLDGDLDPAQGVYFRLKGDAAILLVYGIVILSLATVFFRKQIR